MTLKIQTKIILPMLISLLFISGTTAAGNGPGGVPDTNTSTLSTTLTQTSVCTLEPETERKHSDFDQSQLQFMAEEEKLARDVYTYLDNLWNNNVFSNIANAEQQHMDSVKRFLDAYQIEDLSHDEPGLFSNSELQALYDQLIDSGSNSLVDALKVGALIEEVDIADLLESINQTDDESMIQMYTDLLNGSYSHLRAFSRQLKNQGIATYTAQHLSQQEVDDILARDEALKISAFVMDSSGQTQASESCFFSRIGTGDNLENMQIKIQQTWRQSEQLFIGSIIRANGQDLGQNVQITAVVFYTSHNGKQTAFVQNPTGWQVWDGQFSGLGYAKTLTLESRQFYELFSGRVPQAGDYLVYFAFQNPQGQLVYSANPISFSIQ